MEHVRQYLVWKGCTVLGVEFVLTTKKECPVSWVRFVFLWKKERESLLYLGAISFCQIGPVKNKVLCLDASVSRKIQTTSTPVRTQRFKHYNDVGKKFDFSRRRKSSNTTPRTMKAQLS